MAVSVGFAQFARRMNTVAKIVAKNSREVVQRAAVAADQATVLATPVDTGRARANWRASIGTPDTSTTENTDPTGAGAQTQAQAVIARWPGEKAGPIFISNSLPYIIPLEDGWSAQAPAGMTKFGVQAAEQVLGRARLLAGV